MRLNFLDISLRVPNNSGVAGTNNLADLGGLEWEMLLKCFEKFERGKFCPGKFCPG